MSYWLENGWHYWEGDPRPGANAIEVPQRLSENHVWDGVQWQDNAKGYYYYDNSNYIWVLKTSEAIVAIDAEIIKQQVLNENMVLIKFAKIIFLEINAIRQNQARPQEVTDFINRVKNYL